MAKIFEREKVKNFVLGLFGSKKASISPVGHGTAGYYLASVKMRQSSHLWARYFLTLSIITFYLIAHSWADLSAPVGVIDIIETRQEVARGLTREQRVVGVREYRVRLRQLERNMAGFVSFCAISHLDRLAGLIGVAIVVSLELETESDEDRSVEKYIEFFIILKLIYDEFDRVHGCKSDEGYEYQEYGL